MGILKRAISADASAVAMAVDTTDIVSEIEKIHKTSAVTTAALGRLTTAASMIGYSLKNKDDSVTLRLDGKGPSGALIAVSDYMGNVKSYIQNPVVEIPLNKHGKLDVAGAVGRDGTLSVIKDIGLKEPYSGMIPLVSGEIAEDVAAYFATSEQVPTVCGLGVLVNPDLSVNCAGGYLVQLLPFASDAVIDQIEKNVNNLKSVTQMMSDGITMDELVLKLLDGLEPNLLDEANVEYRCDCSTDRVSRALISLGKEELDSMIAENESKGKGTEVQCHFCNKIYSFSNADLKKLMKQM
ncbi:MAG: Hsp33 family molecular chaperone HslO [Oscillospiraceae bacterium]|nr:Hsp33 family molecular chaperone HslO [Oscillospiraceae bacterium]MBR3536924.1 Hsp33 family molecular chaperone HslO [Oscillospiraceae bacterium]MBR6837121.1 Hsp33 family molecular chaperone HslO [Oscillospiraceae bacterium]